MSESAEQLASFFLYSLFIFPVTNYLVSPQRSYSRGTAAFYAVSFLALVTVVHLAYENSDKGPNHYQLLQVTRDSSIAAIKKSYRALSLEFHPDKNPSPDAAEQFHRVKTAFDVLSNLDLRREYNRLGTMGVELASGMVVDHKVILLQLLLHYVSSLVFAFLMTFSEPEGQAMKLTLFGLLAMLLVECLLVLQEVPLPSWLLPSYTPFDMVAILHRIFPAYMNACRCVSGAFYVDQKAHVIKQMDQVVARMGELASRSETALDSLCDGLLARRAHEQEMISLQEAPEASAERAGEGNIETDGTDRGEASPRDQSRGVMDTAMQEVCKKVAASKEGRSGLLRKFIEGRSQVLKDPALLAKYSKKEDAGETRGQLLLAWVVYLCARYVYGKLQAS